MDANANAGRLVEQEENDLIRKISEFPEILIKAGEALEPYRVVDYLRDLAAAFHKFYSHNRVLTADAELTSARLLLVDATRHCIAKRFGSLG